MTRRNATRTALVTLGLLTLAACVVNLSFEMKKSVAVQTPAAGSFSQNAVVNLGEYKEITDHKNNIKSFDLDAVDITIATVNPGNRATKVSGTLALRQTLIPASRDVLVGAVSNLSIVQGQSVTIKGSPELDAFLLTQLQNAGTFYAVITGGNVDGAADVILDLNMHVSIGYDAGIL